MSGRRRGSDGARHVADIALVAAGAVVAGLLLDRLGLPSAALFGGLLAGLVRGLSGRRVLAVPGPLGAAGQAVLGVSIGALVDLDTLAALGADWLPVLLVVLGTLGLSLGAGLLLRLRPGITPVTGAFSMIAGGASGITVMARELGADDRMVAVLQYLRVLLIVVLMPVAATAVYGAQVGSAAAATGPDGPGWPAGVAFTAGCAVVGVLAGRAVHLPVASLLGPLAVAAAVDLSGLVGSVQVPPVLAAAAFVVIGLTVGLNFDRASLRTIGGALPLALAVIAGVIVASAGLGALLAAATGAGALDAYLATTPGGLYAVLATASDTGADATFVLGVQVLRLFVMLGTAPLLARWLRAGPT